MYPLYENHSFYCGHFTLSSLTGAEHRSCGMGQAEKTGLFRIAPLHFPCRENGGRTLSPDALASFMFKNQGKIPIYLLDFFDVGKEKLFSLRGIICNDEEKKCCITCHVSRLSCAIH